MLRPVKVDDIPKDKYRYGKNVKTINEFLKSDDLAAEVIIKPGENVRNRYASRKRKLLQPVKKLRLRRLRA